MNRNVLYRRSIDGLRGCRWLMLAAAFLALSGFASIAASPAATARRSDGDGFLHSTCVRQSGVAVGACHLSDLLARAGRGTHGHPIRHRDVSGGHGPACGYRRISTSMVECEGFVRKQYRVSVKILPSPH
jgi:hypothetical protein